MNAYEYGTIVMSAMVHNPVLWLSIPFFAWACVVEYRRHVVAGMAAGKSRGVARHGGLRSVEAVLVAGAIALAMFSLYGSYENYKITKENSVVRHDSRSIGDSFPSSARANLSAEQIREKVLAAR